MEKWSRQLSAQSSSSPSSRLDDSRDKDISGEDTDTGTPRISSSQSSTSLDNFENFPPKKRPFLQRLQQQQQQDEAASSSEGEHSDAGKAKESSKDAEESSIINELASGLIDSWKDLKVG